MLGRAKGGAIELSRILRGEETQHAAE
jgi:hypothetical protein